MTEEPINLFCVVGGSPAVVTETIYALCVKPVDERSPETIDRVVAVTTTFGEERILEALPEALEKMAEDYPKAASRIPTDMSQFEIVVPRDYDGNPLSDVRASADSAAMADEIFRQVEALTADDQPRLHTSIAGGRKTMGYFAGNAMMFYGRAGDRVTHVLAGENAERCRDFFYPPPAPTTLTIGADKEFDASKEPVQLHEIPFVRLRDRASRKPPRSFAETIREVQEELVGEAKLIIDLDMETIRWGEQRIRFASPIRTALYMVIAIEHSRGDTPLGTRDLVGIGENSYLDSLRKVYTEVCGGDKDEAFYFGSISEFQGAGLDRKQRNVRTHIGKIKKKIETRVRETEVSLIVPTYVRPKGYTLELDASSIEVIGEELYPN